MEDNKYRLRGAAALSSRCPVFQVFGMQRQIWIIAPQLPEEALAMLAQLLEVLRPTPTGKDRFIAGNMHPAAFRVYGGKVLAQSLRAAVDTVEGERILHSQHAYFLRPGDPGKSIEFEVERARDGLSFSSRRVVALQSGKPIFVSSLSFQAP